MSDATGPIEQLGGLSEVEALRRENQRLRTRLRFANEQCALGWKEARLLARTLDEVTGVPCSTEHLHATEGCPRCGIEPDGTVR